jgi:hypothetical protein
MTGVLPLPVPMSAAPIATRAFAARVVPRLD